MFDVGHTCRQYICIHTHICIFIYMYICVCVCVCVRVCKSAILNRCIRMYYIVVLGRACSTSAIPVGNICIHAYTHVYICMCACVCVCVCVRVCKSAIL